MPATDPQSLLNSANVNCWNNMSLDEQQLFKLAMLQIIAKALNPMAATDPQSLLSATNVNCYRSFGSYPLLELALLQIIANGISSGGGGGGSPSVLSAAYANPNTAGITPTAPALGAIYIQDPADGDGSNVWFWSVANQNWSQFSA